MPKSSVRAHTRQTKHGRVQVDKHDRSTRGGAPTAPPWFQPRRAWRNAKRSRQLFKKSKHTASLLFAGAAVSEVLGFVVFKGAGALFIVLGVGLAVLGYGMKDRS